MMFKGANSFDQDLSGWCVPSSRTSLNPPFPRCEDDIIWQNIIDGKDWASINYMFDGQCCNSVDDCKGACGMNGNEEEACRKA